MELCESMAPLFFAVETIVIMNGDEPYQKYWRYETMGKNVRVFISVPMADRSDEEIEGAIILAKRGFLKKMEELGERTGVSWDFVDNFHASHKHHNDKVDSRIALLSEAIDRLGGCDIAVFGRGWEDARGCQIEHHVCSAYHIPCVQPKVEPEDGKDGIWRY